MRLCAAVALLVFSVSPSHGDVQVRFYEGSPKDRFTITNLDGCALGPTAITIDLAGSSYGLIFDVTGRGAGVEVFQPFDMSADRDSLKAMPEISDGDTEVTLELLDLAAGASLSFTIDVDDTVNNREITVSNTEIAGASVLVQAGVNQATGSFADDAMALVSISSCLS